MASQGPNSPSTAVNDDSAGNVEWLNPGNVVSSNNSYADTSNGGTTGDITFGSVKLLSGSDVGSDKVSGSLSTSDTYASFGGAADKWSWTPTPTLINSPTFGVRIQLDDGFATWGTTYFLVATGFGFSIPTDATIDGILVEIENRQAGGIGYIDHVRVTVHYTPASSGSAGVQMLTLGVG